MSAGGYDLSGRHVLIAGVAEPVGRALAVALAEAGADVSVTTHHDDPAEEVTANSILNECWSIGREGRALRLDLGDLDAVTDGLSRLEQELAPVDLAVNAAFSPPPSAPGGTTPADWSAAIGEGATPAFVFARALGPRMVPRGSGLIVLLVPAASEDPEAAPLRAARAAVVGLAEGLSEEWGPAGVAVEWIEEAPSDELRERLLRAAAGARIVRDPSVPPREGGS